MGTGGSLQGVKRLECEANHSHPSSAEVKNGGAIPPLPHMSSETLRCKHLALHEMISESLKVCGRKWKWPNFRHNRDIRIRGLRKTTKTNTHYTRYLDRNMNPGPPECKARM
jgi:hypothetical protein